MLKCAPPMLRPVDTSAARLPPKIADDWYQTPEHRAWARKVIERAGFRCQGVDCGRKGVRLFADHIREIADGGSRLDPANGQALCGACHSRTTAAARAARLRRS